MSSDRRPSLIDRQLAVDAHRRRRRWPVVVAALCVAALLLVDFGNDVAIALESDTPSRSIGSPAAGRLEHGKRLPSRGRNFRVYSDLGALLGRNSVHDAVRSSVIDAYAALERTRPANRFVYGETGWPRGGPFAPHRTHQNGMAVDFFVPILDAAGKPGLLSTGPLTKFGYGIEFDAEGRRGDERIDFDALADHLAALALAAREHGLKIELVIFDPPLQRLLFATPAGRNLTASMRFSPTSAWVRHDEHYHVVFAPVSSR